MPGWSIDQLPDPADPIAVATFDAYLKSFSDQIEGLWAARLMDVSIVANVDAYKLSATKFRDNANDLGSISWDGTDGARMGAAGFDG